VFFVILSRKYCSYTGQFIVLRWFCLWKIRSNLFLRTLYQLALPNA